MINFKQYYHALCESQERDIQVVYINVRSICDLDNGENCVSNIHDYKCADDTDFLWDAAENDDLDRYAKNFNNYTDAIEGLEFILQKQLMHTMISMSGIKTTNKLLGIENRSQKQSKK